MATTTPTSTAPDAGAGRDRRLLKGALFGAAGLALLVGGGTFALWNDSDILPGGDVTTGDLELTVTAEPSWTLNGDPIGALADVLLVPEDVLVLTQPMVLNANGTSLTATLSVSTAAIPADLVDNLTVDATFTSAETQLAADGTIGPPPVDIDDAAVEANVTIEFDADGLDQQGVTINLPDITFTLQQTTTPTP